MNTIFIKKLSIIHFPLSIKNYSFKKISQIFVFLVQIFVFKFFALIFVFEKPPYTEGALING